MPIAPCAYYDVKSRPVSARARRHAAPVAVLVALWEANYRVYGARKLWKAAQRAGHDIGRDQVARLMRAAGIRGAARTRRVRTTRSDPAATRPADLVCRDFTAAAPNRLWVTNLDRGRYPQRHRLGVSHRGRLQQAHRRLAGRVSHGAEMVLDAVEMARRSRGTRLAGLKVHSDASSQFTSLRYSERLADIAAMPSVGDSYDNALAETVIGLYKTELIRGPAHRRWDSTEDLELATLGWVHWHNHQRLHTRLGDIPPTEFEAAYAAQTPDHQTVRNQ